MKKLYFSLLTILFLTGILNAQKVIFDYDAAGNRISRTIDMSKQSIAKSSEKLPEPITEQLNSERKLKIYPNPTKGILAVEIIGGDSDEIITLSLFNMKGTQLQSKKTDGSLTEVDMTTYPEGTYILRIQMPDKTVDYKVIKQ